MYLGDEKKRQLFSGFSHTTPEYPQKLGILDKNNDFLSRITTKNGIPVNLAYLRVKMIQTGNLFEGTPFGEKELHHKLQERIDQINWDLAKADLLPFIQDKRKLDLWSKPFFLDLIEHLRWVDN